jgi:hypothetical protein
MKMKMLKGLLIVGLSFVFMGCPQDDDTPINNDDNPQELEAQVSGDGWLVTYFFDTDSDETNDFAGYDFSFNSDGTLVASNGTTTVEGTWSIQDDSSSSDDSNDDDLDFLIFFNVSQDSDFEDLNDDWDIISITTNKIELIDVSGGNGGTDYLTLER